MSNEDNKSTDTPARTRSNKEQQAQVDAVKVIAGLTGAQPITVVAVMTLIGAFGGGSLVTALGGATSEDIEQVQRDLRDAESKIDRMEYDLRELKTKAALVESIKSDLSIVRNDLKHMGEKVSEISRLQRPGGD